MKDFLDLEYWEKFGVANRNKLKEYLELVTNANAEDSEYKEQHHIVPKSFDDSLKNEPDNLVWLSGRNHLKAHKLLTQCFVGQYKKKMTYAFAMMCHNKENKDGSFRFEIDGETYEMARKQMSEVFKEDNPAKREDVKKKIAKGGQKRTGKNNGNYGGLSDSNKKHLSESRIAKGTAKGKNNPMYGKKHSEESKRKMSEHSKKPNPKIALYAKNLIWITNGLEEKRQLKDEPIPEGWHRGRHNFNPYCNRISTTIESITNEKDVSE